jgi:acyl carrier protein
MMGASTQSTEAAGLESWVAELLAEYAQKPLPAQLDPRLSLREDLAVESLSLVSLVVRLGDQLGVDASDDGLELGNLITVGDLVSMAQRLEQRARQGASHS